MLGKFNQPETSVSLSLDVPVHLQTAQTNPADSTFQSLSWPQNLVRYLLKCFHSKFVFEDDVRGEKNIILKFKENVCSHFFSDLDFIPNVNNSCVFGVLNFQVLSLQSAQI